VVPSTVCFSNIFEEETAARLNAVDTIIPVSAPFINLAMADPATLHSQGSYVVSKKDSHITRFFLLGVTVFSSLLSGSTARSVSVAFSDRTFPRAIAVLGAALNRKEFVLNMYQGGISLSSYKKTGEYIVNVYKIYF
jgi:hypothetical protein